MFNWQESKIYTAPLPPAGIEGETYMVGAKLATSDRVHLDHLDDC